MSDPAATAGGVTTTQAANTERTSGDAATNNAGAARNGTRVILASSDFGRMLFNSKRQAIYIFQRDRRNKSNCYGECAAAWPPVFTKGRPRAGRGVKSSLLGTIKRRDGKRQVTYAGKPLYYYAHEGPGEVKCHDVNLNGGFWWAVGANGKRLQ
jgi:predicted lipoprotein with Yx(FWY)xxD motif